MNVIKEHMFLVVLGGVTLVIAGLLIFVDSGLAGDIEDQLQQREQFSGKIRRMARGEQVNLRVLEALEADANASERQLSGVMDLALETSKQYDVLRLTRPDGRGEIPAFPWDYQLDEQLTLSDPFVDAYINTIQGLREKLNPTQPFLDQPPEVEIQRHYQSLLQQEQERLEKLREEAPEGSDASTATPDATRYGEEDRGRGIGYEDGPRGIRRGSRFEDADDDGIDSRIDTRELMDRATAKAYKQMVVERANAGTVYLQPFALDRPIRRGARPLLSQMWFAQVGLWVQKDIIDAIVATNRDVAPGDDVTVSEAAVKQLVSVQVDRSYVWPSAMPGRQRDSGGDDRDRREVDLTGQATSQTQEVIRYRFQVVMPYRYANRLQANLMAGKMHTVIGVSSQAMEAVPQGFFYGTEPVMVVTIRGEFRMLSKWTRELMPAEVLANVPESALRPEDRQRLDEKGLTPSGTPSTGGGGYEGGYREERSGRYRPREES